MIVARELRSRLVHPAFRRDAGWSLGSFALYTVLGAVQAIAISRHLGPEVKGYVSILILGPTMAGWLFSLGLTPATMYLAGVARSTTDRLLTMSSVAALVLGAVAAGVAWLALNEMLAGAPEVRMAFGIGLVLLPTLLLREFHGAVLVGSRDVVRFSWASSVARVLSVGLVVVATYTAPPLLFYLTVSTSLALSNVVVIVAAARHLRWRWHWSPATLAEQFRYGIRSHIGGISELGALRFDQFAIFAYLGAAPLGFYSAAVFVSETLILFAYATTMVTFGRLASAPYERALHLSRLTVAAVLAALIVVAVPLWMFAEQLMGTLFGPGFAVAAGVLRILVLAGVVQGLGRVAVSALRALGHPLLSSMVHLVGLAASVPLVLWLVPALGVDGAALASLVAYAVTTVTAVVALYLPQRFTARTFSPRRAT